MNTTDITSAVIVTGATGGIGSAIVRDLYRAGEPTIVAACRNTDRLEPMRVALAREFPQSATRIIGLTLDLADMKSVGAAIEQFEQMGLMLKGIINNAGIMPVRSTTLTPDGFERTLQVNCLATLAFTRRLLTYVEPGGAVVFTSSVTRHLPRLTTRFEQKARRSSTPIGRFLNYGRSKQLLTHYAIDLALHMSDNGVRVNCADPGVVDTGIITLGYKAVDRLADRIFRPLISTPVEGASSALAAYRSPLTAHMFKHARHTPLPEVWHNSTPHHAVVSALNAAIDRLIPM